MCYRNFIILIFLLINYQSLNAQNYPQKIEPNFEGKLNYCFEINSSYYFVGSNNTNNGTQLLLYKTDTNLNILQ